MGCDDRHAEFIGWPKRVWGKVWDSASKMPPDVPDFAQVIVLVGA